MQTTIKHLQGPTIVTKDGDIGVVVDYYFDDKSWTIRYLVVKTGHWLLGRKVLLSPIAVGKADASSGRFVVNLTKKQVEGSPNIDTGQPVSRQHEAYYHGYYGYPYYWSGPYLWGPLYYPGLPADEQEQNEAPRLERKDAGEIHLRSAVNLAGYRIKARDGVIGHVADFMIDDETWEIRYLLVDTRNWVAGKKVLIAPRWIDRVSWDDAKVYVSLSREAIKKAPEYHPNRLNREYEGKLHEHYNRPKYWLSPEPVPKRTDKAIRRQKAVRKAS